MPDRFVESHIKQIPLFQNLTEQQIDLITKAFQVLRFERNELITKEGNPTQGLFIIVSGQGVLTRRQPDGTEVRVGTAEEDQVLNLEAAFHPGTEITTLRVTQPSIVLFLSRNRMNTVLSYYPEVRQRLTTPPQNLTQPIHPITTQPQSEKPIRTTQEIQGMQRDNEDIILIRRRHPWSFIRRGWSALLIFLLFGAGAVGVMFTPTLPSTLCFLPGIIGSILAGLLMTYFFLEWRNDSFVVTDNRVIRIERVIPTFSVNINEIPLESVQQVNTDLPAGDIFARIFDYGNVELKNAADSGDMVLDMIPNPDEVQEAIFANRERRKELAEDNKRNAMRAEIERHLGLNVQAASAAANKAQAPEAPVQKSVATHNEGWSLARMRFINADGNTVIRKHVTIWLQAIIMPLIFFVLALVMGITSLAGFRSLGAIAPISLVGSVIVSIVSLLWFWWSDWDWRNDMYVIADDHVTLIHRRPLWLQNEVDQILLNRVDSVVSETSGFIDTIFQRGDVKLSLIGEGMENAKVFQKVHKPHEIQAELSRRQARAKANAENQEDARQREAIKEYLSVYHETVQNQGGQPAQPPSQPTQSGNTVQPYQSGDRQRPPGIPRSRPKDS